MKNIAIYPGTFDPITNGHIDVIKKALKLADKIIVGISDGNEKNFLFPIDERLKIVSKALYGDLKLSKNKIQVIKFNSLTTELCKKYNSNLILRGLRAVSDFEYEFQLAGMNRKLNNKVETIFNLSSIGNKKFFSFPSDIPTIILSANFRAFLMTSMWRFVIGSNVPGYIAIFFIKLNYHLI